MASHRGVANGVVFEVENGERLKPKDADEVELLKCRVASGICPVKHHNCGSGRAPRFSRLEAGPVAKLVPK